LSQLELGKLPKMASIAVLQLSPHLPTGTDSEQANSLIRSVGMGEASVSRTVSLSLNHLMQHPVSKLKAVPPE
jgi:hypothetical protein